MLHRNRPADRIVDAWERQTRGEPRGLRCAGRNLIWVFAYDIADGARWWYPEQF